MAGIKISELPEASCVVGDELIAIVQDSCTKFVAASAIGATGNSTICSVIAGCGLQGGGSYGAVTLSLDGNCLNKYDGTTSIVRSTSACWDASYTTVQSQSSFWEAAYTSSTNLASCPGLNCVGDVVTADLAGFTSCTGTISGVTTDAYLTGGGTSGSVEVGIDAACVASWNTGGSGGVVAGTACRVARYNSSGGNIEDSNILDSSTYLTIDTNTGICGDLSATNVVFGSDHNYSCGGGDILSGGDTFVVGGNNNTLTEVATTLCNSGLIGGTRNIINGGCNNVIIGGERNCLCENTDGASFKAVTIVGSLSSCVNGESSGIYSATNANVAGTDSVVIGGFDHTTNCSCAFIFGGLCNTVGGNVSTAIGGCCNTAGGFINNFATAIGGTCICASSTRSAAIGGFKNTAVGDDSATIGGCCNCINDGAHTAVIAGGRGNNIGLGDCYTFIGGGFCNCVGEDYASIVGGNANCATECNSFIAGGQSNKICGSGQCGAIIAGTFNQVTHERAAIIGSTSITSVSGNMLHVNRLYANDLPTSDPGVAGVVWNDAGTLKIST